MPLSKAALIARTHGLRARLLQHHQLESLAQARDLESMAHKLAQLGIPVLYRGDSAENRRLTPNQIELGITARQATLFSLLERWGRGHAPVEVILLELEAEGIRRLLRAALGGIPSERRSQGAIPTCRLSPQLITELAKAPTLRDAVTALRARQHPFAPLLESLAGALAPDPLALDLTLLQCWANASRMVLGGGVQRWNSWKQETQEYLALKLDLANWWSAWALAAARTELAAEELFLPGGRYSKLEHLRRAQIEGAAGLSAVLAGTLQRTPFAEWYRTGLRPAQLERGFQQILLTLYRGKAHREPLSSAIIFLFALRLRAENRELRRLVWAHALGPGYPTALQEA